MADADRGRTGVRCRLGKGGLGWYIFESKNELHLPDVFAGLLTTIMIGLLVENVAFRTIEKRTVRRWGMQNQKGEIAPL